LSRFVQMALSFSTAALLVVGCGAGALGGLSITKEEFIKQADLICARADFTQPGEFHRFKASHKEELKGLGLIPYEETIARDHIIPSVKGQIRELEELEPPAGERRGFEALIAGWRRAVREGERDPYSIANFWVPAQDPLAKINKVATRYGFKVCNELR
jgi:hypothetical protein